MSSANISSFTLFGIFLRLGCTSFGGPVAHLAYFREEFVTRRRWFNDQQYADLVALCQFLPGPASSQVGLAIGLSQSGYRGACLAWLGFTLPSALLLTAFALSLANFDWLNPGALQGLKIVAVAVVMQACWGMAKQLCPDARRQVAMLLAACLAALMSGVWGQVLVILLGALFGFLMLQNTVSVTSQPANTPFAQRGNPAWLLAFFAGLLLLPLLAQSSAVMDMLNSYFRTGALVFGGGHVVLPLLQAEVVPHWVDSASFMAGYGAAQAIPGPLFTFAAFLGTLGPTSMAGIGGGLLATVAIFLPSFFLIFGVLPLWQKLVQQANMRAAVAGINASVVGLLLAALYDPVWTSAIYSARDFAGLLLALLALQWMKMPPWAVVVIGALLGAMML